MIKRSQYLAGEVSFIEYYSQFIDDRIRSLVCSHIGTQKLMDSKDEHLNDIPLSVWDKVGEIAFGGSRNLYSKYAELLQKADDNCCACWAVCVLKVAAHQIIEGVKKSDSVDPVTVLLNEK